MAHPYGVEVNFPRERIMAIGGLTTQGLPIVILRDMETGKVFHAQNWKVSTSVSSLPGGIDSVRTGLTDK